ncbi:DUF262 domain-containing protein [Mycena kentingensis (nom. inval.)]|nr:DUF262 domain-containing protein [Mycena kentingensis (nom. inval.)]
MSHNGYDSDSDDDSAPGMFPEATNRSWSVEKLVLQLLNNGRIDLYAEYQRAEVWKDPAQAALIDSVYRNAPVSQLIFAKYVANGRELWRCVDGKQRLTALQRFLAGEISCTSLSLANYTHHLRALFASPVRDKASKTNYWFIDNDPPPTNNRKARAKAVLSERQRESFLSKEIQCVVYNKLRPEQERDIFSRLQCGSPLTSAERIKALKTTRTDMAHEFLAMFLNNPSSPLHKDRRKLGLNRTRETPFRYLLCVLHALETDQMRLIADTSAWILSTTPLKPGVKADMQAAMEVYEAIADTSDALVKMAPALFLASVVVD